MIPVVNEAAAQHRVQRVIRKQTRIISRAQEVGIVASGRCKRNRTVRDRSDVDTMKRRQTVCAIIWRRKRTSPHIETATYKRPRFPVHRKSECLKPG